MRRLGDFFARIAQRFLPDPLALAILLTLLVLAVAFIAAPDAQVSDQDWAARSISMSRIWLDSVWDTGFLKFAMQMCVILLAGFGLARAPIVLAGLRRIAQVPSTDQGAVFLIALTSCIGCWINWGFGLVLAGVLAMEVRREMARRSAPCQYALIVAAAYCGMMIWHGGFSGSAPLKIASDGVELASAASDGTGVSLIEPVAVNGTILSPPNLVLTLGLFFAVPIVLRSMANRNAAVKQADELASPPSKPYRGSDAPSDQVRSPADWINQTRLIPLLLGILFLIGIFRAIRDDGAGAINLDLVNSVFLCAGLLLHRSIASFVAAVSEGGRAIVGIVIQFPLYAGIQGLMSDTGLAVAISHWFVQASQQSGEWLGIGAGATFPGATFFSAALVNFFVPSGGGQWIVQGPIMCGSALDLGVPIEQTVMAIAYGDQLTNMVQPFWAIPLMGMTQVNARDFMGYCALLMILAIPVFLVALMFY